jgi:exonuclease VII large subunit
MKNNIDYYQHYSGADQHPKFKMLRNEYGWEGEGKFWALNNRIAQSEDCFLDISKKYNKASLANDLNFRMDELEDFIQFLIAECELIIKTEKGLTTDMIQENFLKVTKKRKKDNSGYQKEVAKETAKELKNDVSETMAEEPEKEVETVKKVIKLTETEIPLVETEIPLVKNTQSKVKESKGKESKGNEKEIQRKKAPPEAVLFTLNDLNKRLGLKKGFSAFSEKNQNLILARMKDGYSLEDLITVNEKKLSLIHI